MAVAERSARSLGRALSSLCIFILAGPALAYEFPFDDPFVATVVGTPEEYRADLDVKVPLKRRSIEIFPDREVPDIFFYDSKLRYSYALQKGPAPLVFMIAGTGGSHDGSTNRDLGRALYKAGFHFISLSSPTHSNFVVSASASNVPGHAFDDAADLYRVMETIWAKLSGKADVTDFFLTGYSLGAFNTAFVMKVDQERQTFNFKRALMVNSPMRLYSSISLLDRMLENIPGGEDNFGQFYQSLVDRFAQVYKRSDELNLSEDFLYKVYEIYQPKDERLAALIGTVFRLAAANMTFASDVMTDYGYIKPSNVKLRKGSDLTSYNHVAMRLGFTDFFHAYFYPYYKAKNPELTRTSLIEKMSLTSIEDFLRSADNIYVTHNEDDLILEPGQIDFFRDVFGERAMIYPNGGHLGNMMQRDYVAHIIELFQR